MTRRRIESIHRGPVMEGARGPNVLIRPATMRATTPPGGCVCTESVCCEVCWAWHYARFHSEAARALLRHTR